MFFVELKHARNNKYIFSVEFKNMMSFFEQMGTMLHLLTAVLT
jgi:hypothetical protein